MDVAAIHAEHVGYDAEEEGVTRGIGGGVIVGGYRPQGEGMGTSNHDGMSGRGGGDLAGRYRQQAG